MDNDRVSPPFTDKTLTCTDCGKPFLFSAGEARYMFDRHLSVPKRCQNCRLARKRRIPGMTWDDAVEHANVSYDTIPNGDHKGVRQ